MAEESFITNAEGNFFTQEKRSEAFEWETCTGVGDIEIPRGTRTPNYCPDPLSSGRFKIHGFIRGAPGAGTYTLNRPLGATANRLLELGDCDFVGRINWVCRGIRQDPQNYETAVLMFDSAPDRAGIVAPVVRQGDEEARVDTNMNVSFSALIILYNLTMARVSMMNTADALSIYFLPKRCEDRCGPARDLCQVGLMGLDSADMYVYESEVKKTTDGSTWTATLIDPYTFGGATGPVLMFETATGDKLVVFRTESVLGAPAECGISTDGGATWDNYAIGAVNGQAVNAVALHGADIFAACTGGYIYKSANQGMSWSVVKGAVAPLDDLDWICFYKNVGYAGGVNNAFLSSLDGGETWSAGTGPAAGAELLSGSVNDKGHLEVGTDDGRLFRSEDRGVTWATWVDWGGGSVDWIDFDEDNNFIGGLIYNNTSGRGYLYRSEDGGATWQRIDSTPNNSGLSSGFICDPNTIWVVGAEHGGSTFVAKTSPGALA